MELRVEQKKLLYTLKKIKLDNPNKEIIGLDEAINFAEAVMEQEDVALVSEKLKQLKS